MPPLIDLTGKRFGRLVVTGRDTTKAYKKPHWFCQCDCGNTTSVYGYSLTSGATQSCGCLHKERTSQASALDLAGRRFGRLTVIERDMSVYGKGKHSKWVCQCECGNIISCTGESLMNGQISCGCSKSIGEYHMRQILTENGIKFKSEYSFDDLKYINKLRYDIAILDENDNVTRLIEFDGKQHRNKDDHWYTEEVDIRDRLKNDYALSHNIPLVRLPYETRDCLTLGLLLGDKYLYKGEEIQ